MNQRGEVECEYTIRIYLWVVLEAGGGVLTSRARDGSAVLQLLVFSPKTEVAHVLGRSDITPKV